MTVYAACCQTAFACPTHRDEIPDRVDRMLEMAASAVDGYEPFHDVRLIVFPEFAHSAPIHPNLDDLETIGAPFSVVFLGEEGITSAVWRAKQRDQEQIFNYCTC